MVREWAELVAPVESRDLPPGREDVALCDNDDCARTGHRETFMKCTACWFATYCNEGCQTVGWTKWRHKESCKSYSFVKQTMQAQGLTSNSRLDAPDDDAQTHRQRTVIHDMITARPFLRAVAAASARPPWELCVLIDYTYSSPMLSVQPIAHLDKSTHPFAGGRKILDEVRLSENRGRLTAVITKSVSGVEQLAYDLEGYLMHHILGEDNRSEDGGFRYSPPIHQLLMEQPKDLPDIGEALRVLRGSGRPTKIWKSHRFRTCPVSGVLQQ